MTAYAAPIDVVQAALHRVAEEHIVSLDEGSAAALVTSSNYEGIVEANLTRHAWGGFAGDTIQLTLEGTISKGGYVRSYAWPAGALVIRWVEACGRRLRSGEYRVQRRKILTMFEADFEAQVTMRAAEHEWPADFCEAMVVRMQAHFLESLCEKPQDARLLKRDAETLFKAAIVRDRRQFPPEPCLEVNGLAEVWRGARSRRG